MTNDELLKLHEKRLKRILDTALSEDDETIILGAFGCGAFMNDPQIVAQVAKNVIREYLYSFKNIEFAVYCSPRDDRNCESPLPCGTVVPMEVASNSRDSYPFLTKRLAVRTNQGIFTYAAIPLTGIPFGFSLWNPYTSGAERNV